MADQKPHWVFSDMRTATHLKHCFGISYQAIPRCLPQRGPPSRALRELMGIGDMDSVGWNKACKEYTSLFSQGDVSRRDRLATPLPSPLARVFDFLRLDVGRNLFTNGRGKLLLYELLTLFPGRSYRVAISTTTNPYKDWCGVYCDNISGVVDLLVEDPALGKGGPKVFGEVKGGSSIYAGLWQLIAAMQAAALVSTKWPTGKCE